MEQKMVRISEILQGVEDDELRLEIAMSMSVLIAEAEREALLSALRRIEDNVLNEINAVEVSL